MYIGTGIQISQRQLKRWAGRENRFKIIVADFSSVFRSRQKFLCPIWKNTVLYIGIIATINSFRSTLASCEEDDVG
jgi:hypothetical protein